MSPASEDSRRPDRPACPTRWLPPVGALLLVFASFGWVFTQTNNFPPFSPQPDGYYALLTDALLSGQLHLKITPDPRLLELENPYAGNQGVSRPHDMTFFEGKFYLSYGITPFLLLSGPWTWLFGTFLSDGALTSISFFAGLLLSLAWYARVRQAHFPHLSPWWDGAAILLLGWGNGILLGATSGTFYLVPISAAFCCAMAVVYAVERAWTTGRFDCAVTWLGLASLAAGLLVAARPNTILTLPWLALPALQVWHRHAGPPGASLRPVLRIAWWLIFPALAVGLGMAFYNMLRFADPLEFGMRFTMNPEDIREMTFFSPENFWAHLKVYLFAGADHTRYFPFFRPFDTDAIGIAQHWPWLLLTPLGFATALVPALPQKKIWLVRLTFIAGIALTNFLLLCCFAATNWRYMLDFAPMAMLAALLAALLVAERCRLHLGLAARLTTASLSLLAIVTAFHGTTFAISRYAGHDWFHTVARVVNQPIALAEHLLGTAHGPLELRVRFSPQPNGTLEPLLTTGAEIGRNDILYARHESDGRISLGFFHLGLGGPVSAPQSINFTAEHSLSLDLGSLYPPASHPLFRDHSATTARQYQNRLQVSLNGNPVLNTHAAFYYADPADVHVGYTPFGEVTTRSFSGEILKVSRPGPVLATNVTSAPRTPLRMTLKFPPLGDWVSQPLLAWGTPADGDTIFVTFLPGNRLRFGHDRRGAGAVTTSETPFDPAATYVIEIDPGTTDNRFRLRFNGQLLIDATRSFSPAGADEILWGYNAAQSSFCAIMFSGAILDIAPADASNWSDPPAGSGLARIVTHLPAAITPIPEPLLTTGRTGAGDIIYLRRIDRTHVAFGHDHWGTPSHESEPLRLDPVAPHEIWISAPALYPPGTLHDINPALATYLRRHLFVFVNRKLVYSSARNFHPTTLTQVAFLKNPIGGSTCTATFSGESIVTESWLPDQAESLWSEFLAALPTPKTPKP